jgi:hypothetical protein
VYRGELLYSRQKTLVNHAKSDALKRQIARKEKDDLMAQAVARFQTTLGKCDTASLTGLVLILTVQH